MGSDGAQAAFDAISGKTVAANIDTGTAMVTKDNAADFGG
jgi:ABC-type sugar transport system substrate-binding protein